MVAKVRRCVGHVQRLVLKRASTRIVGCSAVALFELSDSVYAEPMRLVRHELVLSLRALSPEKTESQASDS